jgi:tetratricopeptide (TPR) repeat protein
MRASAIAFTSAVIVVILGVVAAAQPVGEDESADLVTAGRDALRKGRYRDAAKALDQAIALNPRRIEAYVLRGAVHAANREYAQGVKLLQRAQLLAPDNLDVLSGLGTHLFLSGEIADGVALLERVVAAAPDRYEAQSVLGKHYAGSERWKDAIVALEAYLAARPERVASADPQHQLHLAEAYLRARRPLDARTLYDRVIDARPDEPAARMGRAWALAAIDCRDARKALDALDDLIAAHPQILLVQGQCQLALGDARRALALGERYLERAPGATAAGHALVGEAAAALGDLKRATRALTAAREKEPKRRRWALKLAIVLRRSGDGAGAIAELDRMGPPKTPAADPAWWRELGEALIVARTPGEVAARLAPAIDALPDDAALLAIAGEAALRAGDVAGAIAQLDAAERAGSTSRSRSWLARALEADAAARLDGGDLALAEVALARADRLGGGAAVARNLGVVRLALDRPDDAIDPLERAAATDPAPEVRLALGQARARAGQIDGARKAYAEAAKLGRGRAVAALVAIDRAALELDADQPAAALDAIEAAEKESRQLDGADAAAYADAARAAHHVAGVAALRGGSASRATSLLVAADKLAGGKDVAIRCDLALATVATGDRDAARRRLKAVAKATCPFPAPADTQAVPILLAFLDGLEPRKADKALQALARLQGKATGATRRLLATATRVVALGAAERAYLGGDVKKARRLLVQAKRAETKAGTDELAHNLAVLDVVDGKLADAAAALEKLAPKLPEALINLGVVADRRGDSARALDRWRQARRAGVRFAPLDEWIAAKERIFGGDR